MIKYQELYEKAMISVFERDEEIKHLKMRNEVEIAKNKSQEKNIDKLYDEITENKQKHAYRIYDYQSKFVKLLQMFVEDGDY